MERALSQTQTLSLLDDTKTCRKLEFNLRKNKAQDMTERMDALAANFRYEDCRDRYWNPEAFSLLYGTPLWTQASETQRVLLNQLYWVAYYSQIISAEIATIFFNQTSAAGLYALEDFRLVGDTLDLESMQERAHINAFKTIGERMEKEVFGERIFSYPMKGPYTETMMHKNASRVEAYWRNLQLRAFALLSSGNAFIACQYFTVRGLRTLNGKLVQHRLSQFYSKDPQPTTAPAPSEVSFCHFMDESFHFNSSTILSHDVVRSLKPPTRFERWVVNRGIEGMQRDHTSVSTAINGLFWYDPALYPKVYRVLRSRHFGMGDAEARLMMEHCFARETQAMHDSFQTRTTAMESYREYVCDLEYVDTGNRAMSVMARHTVEKHLLDNRQGLRDFFRRFPAATAAAPVPSRVVEAGRVKSEFPRSRATSPPRSPEPSPEMSSGASADRSTIHFVGSSHAPVRLGPGCALSEALTIGNSPLLFGCRTGICGTCLVEVEPEGETKLSPPGEDERELLEIVAPGNPGARLACQLRAQGDLRLRYLGLSK